MVSRHRELFLQYLRTDRACCLYTRRMEVRCGGTPQPPRETRALPGLRCDRQRKKFVKLCSLLQVHDDLLQFFALFFADHIAA